MYNDGVITTEFTGYYDSDEGEYISPSGHQNLLIKFPAFYLSADDGDIADSGVTITSETGEAEDITIGNAPAKVLTATMLNPVGLMEGLTWGEGTVYIGVATATEAYDSDAEVYVKKGTAEYAITDTQIVPPTGTAIGYQGDPAAIVVSDDGTAWFYTDTNAYYYDGSAVAEATQSDAFVLHKYQNAPQRGILLDANGLPSDTWANGESNTYTYVPMGVYDFSNVDAFGITFGVEAYDRMTPFDADATDWVASLDFTTAKTLSTILSELMTEMGFSGNYTVSASAVNTGLTYTENPITAYAVTYRQILRWIAEAMGCNARMGRTGGVELYTFDSTSQETITPYTIISNTRTKARYTVPQITEVVCYDTLGMNYASGSEGVPYYIAANPFLTGLDTSVAPLTNICTLLRGIPVYYPSVIGQMYADPRLDTGDFVTLQTTDGTTPYAVPVMRQTLHWGGVCEATLVASGNQTRAVPSDLIDNNLSTTVNGRKILEGVDAKRITVLDEDENILFNADTETDEVYIAGFTVGNDKFSYTKETASSTVAGENDTETVEIANGHISTSATKWDDLGSGAFTYDITSDMSQGELHLTVDTTNDPDGGKRTSANIIGGMVSLEYEKGNVRRQVLIDPEAPHSIQVVSETMDSGGNYSGNTVWIGDEDIKLHTDSPDRTLTITASGPTVEGNASSEDVSIPNNTVTELDSWKITPGTYLITATARFMSNTTGYRAIAIRSGSTPSISTNLSRELCATAAPVSGIKTRMCISGIQTFTSSSVTLHLYVQQTSGNAINCSWAWHYVRLA